MARKDFEDLKKGDLVVYKLPGGKKSYGVYMDVQFSKTGDIAIVKDMLETPKKTIKVKMSNITSVMDNFLEGKAEPKSEALKIVQDAIEAGKNAVINCIPSKTADGSECLSINWNNSKFDEYFTTNDCIDLDAFVRETPTSVDIVVSRPITKVFTYTKKPNGDLASLRQFIGNFDNTVNDIFNVIRAKFIEFNAKWNKITDDSKDYVNAYLGRAFIDGMSEAVEDTGETPLENQATTQTTSNTKFRLTDESKTVNGIKLYRIEALKDLGFYGVKQGDKGGFVESEANLSQNLDSWIGDNACVYNKAFVGRNSFVGGNAIVNDRAQVKENTRVTDNAQVSGQSSLTNSDISGDAVVSGSVTVVNAGSKLVASGKTQVLGKVVIDGRVDITDKAKIDGTSQGIYLSNVKAADEAEIIATGSIESNVQFIGKCSISGNVRINVKPLSGGSTFTFKDIKTSGKFRFNSDAFGYSKTSIITPADFGDKELAGDITIVTPQDLLKVINEAVDKSEINEAPNLKKYIVKNAKQWAGPQVKDSVLTSAQVKYLKELPQIDIDADSSPQDVELDNTYAIEQGNPEDVREEVICNVANIYYFYGYLGKGDSLQYIIKLPKKLFA